ncbi:hypothetical protein CYLTODRAFT_447719 [Cylindrobasidium torrendii FP15055 ss-10]|uniref:Uncharacterized protein n=1 Tax=Cylindrobasidium torrendii FP15055 ss-10 TaxID=1314674 RepID=A0A0D7AU74_9AGAR|nr:hypothetical protein CYLTODRAFT_447719 [Cylindrobasidium torrendii FP15055 ss-10]
MVDVDPDLASILYEANQALLTRFQSLRDATKNELAASNDEKAYATRSADIFMLKHFNGRLHATGTFADCVRVWAACQRLHIEILAFINFMTEYRALLREPPLSARPVDVNRIGAITTDPATAEKLFLVGLPVYFVRPRGEVDIKDVVRMLSPDEMAKLLQARVIVRVGQQAGAPNTEILFRPTHPRPSTPVIFNGSPTNPNRVFAIYAWSRKTHPLQIPADEHDERQIEDLKKYGLVGLRQPGGSVPVALPAASSIELPLPDASSTMEATASTSRSALPAPDTLRPLLVSSSSQDPNETFQPLQQADESSRQGPRGRGQNYRRSRGRGRGTTYRGRHTSSGATPNRDSHQEPKVVPRNKWIRTSEFMPDSLPEWEREASLLGAGHSETVPPSWPKSTDTWRNYVVPEPALVAAMHDKQRDCAILNCARFREALAYRVENNVSALKNATWRFICTVGYVVSSGSNQQRQGTEETATMKKRAAALEEFNKSILDAGLTGTLNLDNLPDTIPWRGAELKVDQPLPRHIAQAILGDLNEMSFRWELANLDGELYDWDRMPQQNSVDEVEIYGQQNVQSMNREQRRWEVAGSMTYFNGTFVPNLDTFYNEPRGFASPKLSDRVETLLDLAHLMDQWVPQFRVQRDVLERIETLAKLYQPLLSTAAVAVTITEREIAHHYIHAFKQVFSRAPILPYTNYLPM